MLQLYKTWQVSYKITLAIIVFLLCVSGTLITSALLLLNHKYIKNSRSCFQEATNHTVFKEWEFFILKGSGNTYLDCKFTTERVQMSEVQHVSRNSQAPSVVWMSLTSGFLPLPEQNRLIPLLMTSYSWIFSHTIF